MYEINISDVAIFMEEKGLVEDTIYCSTLGMFTISCSGGESFRIGYNRIINSDDNLISRVKEDIYSVEWRDIQAIIMLHNGFSMIEFLNHNGWMRIEFYRGVIKFRYRKYTKVEYTF